MDEILPGIFQQKYAFLRSQRSTDLLLLDEEVSRIGTLVQEAIECTAQANEIRELAKEDLKLAYAVAADRLRKELLPSNKTRSESQIDSEIPLDPNYQAAQDRLGQARLDASLWESMAEGMRTKSSSLRVTTDLVQAGFLSQNYILDKRRQEIRNAAPAVERKKITPV